MKSCVFLLLSFLCAGDLCAQWKKVNLPTAQDLYDIQSVGNIVYAVGNNSAIIRSADTGKGWQNLVLTIPSNLRALYFFDSLRGYVIGENARIQKTVNGGKSWTQKYIKTAAYGYDMEFQGRFGVAVGKDMMAISSSDTGNTWTVDTTFSKFKKLNSVCIMPDGNCWAVGDSGYILSKKINARKWKISKYPTGVDLNHISVIGNSTLVITGGTPDTVIVGKYYNILLISTDTGKTWQQNSIGEMKIINSAFFHNADTGFLAGSNGLISKCSSGVSNRGLQLTGSASTFNKIWFADGIGMVVGDGGALYRTSNDGGKVLAARKEELQNQLCTVYPNPGNGEFTITSEHKGYELRVFDMQGRVVHTAGDCDQIYSFTLSSSGVYTLWLQLPGYISVCKKIVVYRLN